MRKNDVPIPIDEPDRLEALRRYQILDTPPDGAFDQITAVAAVLFRVPIAIVSLVDHDRIWFKSHTGIDVDEVGREPGLCASAILSPDLYQVHDAKVDARTLTNPLVTGQLGLRFYAAAPLRTHDGFNLGTLCVSDHEPREMSTAEGEMLTKLASLVMDQMELRLGGKKGRRAGAVSAGPQREAARRESKARGQRGAIPGPLRGGPGPVRVRGHRYAPHQGQRRGPGDPGPSPRRGRDDVWQNTRG